MGAIYFWDPFHAHIQKQCMVLQHAKWATCIVYTCIYKLSRGIFIIHRIYIYIYLKMVNKVVYVLGWVHEDKMETKMHIQNPS